jgi:GNAT superfamily N-acetyltransferase
VGVGRNLVGAVESWARDRGIETVSVRSNIVRVEAHPFYQSMGFDRVKTQHAYRKKVRQDGD